MRTDANLIAAVRIPAVHGGELDRLMLLGFLAACAAIVFFFFQRRSRASMLAFAVSMTAGGVYGLLSGVWPLACVQFLLAANRFIHAFKMAGYPRIERIPAYHVPRPVPAAHLRGPLSESRIKRLFGSV